MKAFQSLNPHNTRAPQLERDLQIQPSAALLVVQFRHHVYQLWTVLQQILLSYTKLEEPENCTKQMSEASQRILLPGTIANTQPWGHQHRCHLGRLRVSVGAPRLVWWLQPAGIVLGSLRAPFIRPLSNACCRLNAPRLQASGLGYLFSWKIGMTE